MPDPFSARDDLESDAKSGHGPPDSRTAAPPPRLIPRAAPRRRGATYEDPGEVGGYAAAVHAESRLQGTLLVKNQLEDPIRITWGNCESCVVGSNARGCHWCAGSRPTEPFSVSGSPGSQRSREAIGSKCVGDLNLWHWHRCFNRRGRSRYPPGPCIRIFATEIRPRESLMGM